MSSLIHPYYNTIAEHIEAGRWDCVQPYDGPLMAEKGEIVNEWIVEDLLAADSFTDEAMNALLRVHGEATPEEWYDLFVEVRPNLSALRYFAEGGLLGANLPSNAFDLFNAYIARTTRKEEVEYLIGLGASVHDAHPLTGDTHLHTLVHGSICEKRDGFDCITYGIYEERIAFLLGYGADPLRPNHAGVSAHDLMRLSGGDTSCLVKRD